MKLRIKKQLRTMLCALLACLIAFVAVPEVPVEAATAVKAPTCVKTMTSYFVNTSCYTKLAEYSQYIYIKNLASNAKITNIKSSNKKVYVTSLNKDKYRKVNALYMELDKIKANEKTKITCTVKQNNKSYNLTCTVTFKAAPTPFKTFQLGKKNYTSSFKGKQYLSVKSSTAKAKLTITAASGYKIDSITLTYLTSKGQTTKKVKSGTTIATKNLFDISVTYHITKLPTNYQKPSKWNFEYVASPLHSAAGLSFTL
jgi:hypothetical protein